MNKLISIIIPNFNKEAFIEETLDSVLNQSYPHWEAIIVEDGSTDSSLEKINAYVNKDLRFKLHLREKEVKGASTCRNIGIAKAKGEFIVFLDSDDILLPDCLKNRLEFFINNMEMDFLVFPMGTFIRKLGDNPMVWRMSTKNSLDKFLTHNLPWTIVSPIWKKEFIERLGGFDTRYHRLQDVEFHTRALLSENLNFLMSVDDRPDSYYRIGEERKSTEAENFYTNWVASVGIYIDSMHETLTEKGEVKRIKLLKGTLIKTITSILFANEAEQIDQDLTYELITLLSKKADEMGWSFNYLKLYVKLYQYGLYKIKGFNFIFQHAYIYL